MNEILPSDLKKKIDAGEKVFILDVREPDEFRLANIGGTLIPLGELTQSLDKLNRDTEIFCLCHHGGRSRQAVGYLASQGFQKVVNITGGIDRWSVEVDPTVRRY